MSSSLYKITIPKGSSIKKDEVLELLKHAVYVKCINNRGVPRGYKIDFKDGDKCNLVPDNLCLIRC
jgi:hypothetical protein